MRGPQSNIENEFYQPLTDRLCQALLENDDSIKMVMQDILRMPIRLAAVIPICAIPIMAGIQLLKDRHISAVTALLNTPVDITRKRMEFLIEPLAREAAFYGYAEFLDTLSAFATRCYGHAPGIMRNAIVHGAARKGDFSYVEELLSQGALYTEAATGAAEGGYYAHAHAFIQKLPPNERDGAIETAGYQAARYGQFDYVKRLLVAHPELRWLVCGAAFHAGYDGFVKDMQLEYLAMQPTPDFIDRGILIITSNGLSFAIPNTREIPVETDIFQRAQKIISLRRPYPNLSLPEGMAITDKENFGALCQFIALCALGSDSYLMQKTRLPCEILFAILSYNFKSDILQPSDAFGLFLSKNAPQKSKREEDSKPKETLVRQPM